MDSNTPDTTNLMSVRHSGSGLVLQAAQRAMYAAALSPETALLTDAVAVSTALAPPEAAATMAGGDATLRFFGLGDTPSALALERVIAADVEGTADVEVAEVAAAPDEVADEPLKCLLVFIAAEQKD